MGASGDLAPLAHLALPLIGRGQVELRRPGGPGDGGPPGVRPGATDAPEAKEGLALLNGTQLMSAIGALLLWPTPTGWHGRRPSRRRCRSRRSWERMSPTRRRTSLRGRTRARSRWLASCGTCCAARDSRRAHHGSAHKVQDPYSLRCVPQVHGAVRDALDHLRRVLDIELNSATDNPLVFPAGGAAPLDALATGGGLVISGGNFHGEPIALALDFAKLAISELGAISERRTALLLDPRLNGGLPAFLSPDPGRNSGLMIAQYTAAALASENKVYAHPSSADSIPTSANQEDHVSMGAASARHARTVLGHVEQILAIELLCAAQALDLRLARMAAGPGGAAPAPGAGVLEAHRRLRERIPFLAEDREPGPDLAAALALVHEGALVDLVAG